MDRIAYYAHHVGSGHLQHALNLARSGVGEVLVITSAPTVSPEFEVARIAPDIVQGYNEVADSPFHYAPNAPELRERFAQIHTALTKFTPDVVISDVSAEVAMFARLSGYPVITRRMHGSRNDRAHLNMYDAANALLAFYPESLESDALLPRHRDKTFFAGMLAPAKTVPTKPIPEHVVVLSSLGGDGIDLTALSRAASVTNMRWTVAGNTHGESTSANVEVLGLVEEPEELLSTASIAICSAGHNAVRTTAAAGVPMITFPEQRPHDEQLQFARSLESELGIPCVTGWYQDWLAIFEQAQAVDVEAVRSQLFTDMPAFKAKLKQAIDFAVNR